MGQHTTPTKIDYYCNDPCFVAHGVQDVGIHIRKENANLRKRLVAHKKNYLNIITEPEEYDMGTDTVASILSFIGFYKHLLLFNEGLLARKSTEELHLLRMKAKKYAGEMLEHSMVVQDDKMVDEFSSIMQGNLAEDNNYNIAVFALD